MDLKFKRQGPLYVPEREPVRRYSPQDLDRYERYKRRHQPQLAFTLIDSGAVASSDGNPAEVTLDTTGANLIVVGAAGFSAPAITDTGSNTWNGLTAQVGSFDCTARLFWFYNPAGTGAGHVFTNTSTQPGIAVLAFSGSAASPFDQQNGAVSGTGNNGQPGSVTPTTDAQVLVSFIAHFNGGDNFTIDSGFTRTDYLNYISGFGAGLGMAYKIQTTAGAENPTWSWTGSGNNLPMVIATFKSGAAAAPTKVGSLLPMFR